MAPIARPIRIVDAFDDPDHIKALFRANGPYDCLGVAVPDGVEPDDGRDDGAMALPWFRGNWVVSGQSLIEGSGGVLFNQRFLDAAQNVFNGAVIVPTTVVVNLNSPMVSGAPHVDIPAFRGAKRDRYPLRLLSVMGESGLFERWRIVEAGAISWIYEGVGGEFDYWPDGLNAAMATESPPFGNVAIVADNNRMYHRVRAVGKDGQARRRVPRNSRIAPVGDDGWAIFEADRLIANYRAGDVRMSVLWKAEVFKDDADLASKTEDFLTPDTVIERFCQDLHARGKVPILPNNISDENWIATLQRTYYPLTASGRL